MDYKEFRERYQYDLVKDLVGQGGFGRVFRARDVILDRWVALKVFSRDVPQQYDLISEIKKAINLNHPNICRYNGVEVLKGINALGEPHVIQVGIMEFIEGGTIGQFLKKRPEFRKKLLTDVLHGLSYLHQHQPPIIHRDLKPPNVLVGFENGVPVAKITDFGISKFSSESGARVSVVGVGTYAYMAPEQLNPVRYGVNGKIQGNLDLWSFGAMTIELLTGVLPFGGDDPEVSTGQIQQAIINGIPAQVLAGFEEPYRSVLRRCMIQDAGKRAQRASELISLFETQPQASADQRRQTVVEDPSRQAAAPKPKPVPDPVPHPRTVVDPNVARRMDPAPIPDAKQAGDAKKHGRGWSATIKAIWPVIQNVFIGLLGLAIAGAGIGLAVDDQYIGPRNVLLLAMGTSLIALAFPIERLRSKIVLASALFTLLFLLGLMFWADVRMVCGLFLGAEALCVAVAAIWHKSPKLGAICMGFVFAGCGISAAIAELSLISWGAFLLALAACLLFVIGWFRPRFLVPNALVPLGCVAVAIFLVATTPIVMFLASVGGDLSASQSVAEGYVSGEDAFQHDLGRGSELLRTNCERSIARACERLGRLYLSRDFYGGVELDNAKFYFDQACIHGNSLGCSGLSELGDAYRNGTGVAKDEYRAGTIYASACRAGYASACNQLFNVAFDFGSDGVPVDKTKAAGFYQSACDGGSASACTNLGLQYELGTGVAKDLAKSASLYTKACDGKEAAGCSNLGQDYWLGRGVAQDKAKGRELLQKGCSMGNQWGCDQLKETQ